MRLQVVSVIFVTKLKWIGRPCVCKWCLWFSWRSLNEFQSFLTMSENQRRSTWSLSWMISSGFFRTTHPYHITIWKIPVFSVREKTSKLFTFLKNQMSVPGVDGGRAATSSAERGARFEPILGSFQRTRSWVSIWKTRAALSIQTKYPSFTSNQLPMTFHVFF